MVHIAAKHYHLEIPSRTNRYYTNVQLPVRLSPFEELLAHVRERRGARAQLTQTRHARTGLAVQRLERRMCRSALRFCKLQYVMNNKC